MSRLPLLLVFIVCAWSPACSRLTAAALSCSKDSECPAGFACDEGLCNSSVGEGEGEGEQPAEGEGEQPAEGEGEGEGEPSEGEGEGEPAEGEGEGEGEGAPTVVLARVDDSPVEQNSSFLVRWSSTNATGCALTRDNHSTSVEANGELAVDVQVAAVSVTIVCTGPGGTADDTLTVAPVLPASIDDQWHGDTRRFRIDLDVTWPAGASTERQATAVPLDLEAVARAAGVTQALASASVLVTTPQGTEVESHYDDIVKLLFVRLPSPGNVRALTLEVYVDGGADPAEADGVGADDYGAPSAFNPRWFAFDDCDLETRNRDGNDTPAVEDFFLRIASGGEAIGSDTFANQETDAWQSGRHLQVRLEGPLVVTSTLRRIEFTDATVVVRQFITSATGVPLVRVLTVIDAGAPTTMHRAFQAFSSSSNQHAIGGDGAITIGTQRDSTTVRGRVGATTNVVAIDNLVDLWDAGDDGTSNDELADGAGLLSWSGLDGVSVVEQEIYTRRFGSNTSPEAQHSNNLAALDGYDAVTFEASLVWMQP